MYITEEEVNARRHSLMTVLIESGGDCTNNGITRRKHSLTIWDIRPNGRVHLPTYGEDRQFALKCEFMDDDDLILTTVRRGHPSLDNPPAAKWVGALRKGHCMFGGSFVYTSNAVITDYIGYRGPIAVHDRVE